MKRRRLLKLGPRIMLFLLAGAIVNVAVAWALACSGLELRWPPRPIAPRTSEALSRRYLDVHFFVPQGKHYDGFGQAFDLVALGDNYLSVARTSHGWPFLSMYSVVYSQLGPPQYDGSWFINSELCLPLIPLWPGFAMNTLFYAAILWLVSAAPFALRRRRRIQRGLCARCGYPIGSSERCTECGKPVNHTKSPLAEASPP